jgi:hypothetical protein
VNAVGLVTADVPAPPDSIPFSAGEDFLSQPKFSIGQLVRYSSKSRFVDIGSGEYVVVGHRPTGSDGLKMYRIQSTDKRHERIAEEEDIASVS